VIASKSATLYQSKGGENSKVNLYRPEFDEMKEGRTNIGRLSQENINLGKVPSRLSSMKDKNILLDRSALGNMVKVDLPEL